MLFNQRNLCDILGVQTAVYEAENKWRNINAHPNSHYCHVKLLVVKPFHAMQIGDGFGFIFRFLAFCRGMT